MKTIKKEKTYAVKMMRDSRQGRRTRIVKNCYGYEQSVGNEGITFVVSGGIESV